ncbi:MAG: hypothetical protein UZ12_BCD005000699 [Bacteroidetes bacterium OLB12]|nr:MAG: hypothetical protein UZ12_BCD005000699 [Bacteroidetes bacterium OLB12]
MHEIKNVEPVTAKSVALNILQQLGERDIKKAGLNRLCYLINHPRW